MSDAFLSDEDIDAMYEENAAMVSREDAQNHAAHGMAQIPLYPLSTFGLGQAAPAPVETFISRKFAGIPVWGWGLAATALGGAGWWWMNREKVTANPESHEPPSAPELPEGPSGWSPSRGQFGDILTRHLQRRGITDKAEVFTDADDAKKKLKHVSPLVTLRVNGGYKVEKDKDLDKLCRREGLQPITHEDGTIGFYPTTSKRGREWEKYVDDLRDDGQKV